MLPLHAGSMRKPGRLVQGLLQRTSAQVSCLVRCESPAHGRQRLLTTLQHYELSVTQDMLARVHIVPGDLCKARFGLEEDEFSRLADLCDVVFHLGAYLNFLYGYDAFIASNVIGTQEALRFACFKRTKQLHLVSTLIFLMLADHTGHDATTPIVLDEDSGLSYGRRGLGGYGQSKWVAEKMATIARSRGLPVTVYRPGLVLGHSQTGACHTGELFTRVLKGILQSGVAPLSSATVEVAPVDFVSDAILLLASRESAVNQTYHTIVPEPAAFYPADVFNDLGYHIRNISVPEWIALLREHVAHDQNHALQPLVPYFTIGWPPTNESILACFGGRPRIVSTRLAQEIQGSGIQIPSLFDTVSANLRRLIAAGEIPPPTRIL